MMLWLIFGAMLFVAALVVAMPLYRSEKRLSPLSAISVLSVVLVAATMYSYIGSPNVDPQQASAPDVNAMVASLANRLNENPDDLAGWKMLGRSYVQLKNFPGAVAAFGKAAEIEGHSNAQTLADLGEAMLLGDSRTILGRAGQLFDSALAVQPHNPKALFYAGLAAAERGDNELAASRWEALLATSPPPNIEGILRQRVAELRGQAPATAAPTSAPLVASIELGADAQAANLPDATVFVIARDPAQPSPPVAVVRRQLSDLPTSIAITDADAMIPGRLPSAFPQIEIVARVSLTGQPIAQSGDWFGSETVATGTNEAVIISINTQVP